MFYQRLLSNRNKDSVAAEIEKSAPKPEYAYVIKIGVVDATMYTVK